MTIYVQCFMRVVYLPLYLRNENQSFYYQKPISVEDVQDSMFYGINIKFHPLTLDLSATTHTIENAVILL